jgi:ABC-type phosphate/phosphonate transport system ATPase subunit
MGNQTPKAEDIVPSIAVNGLNYKFPDGTSGLQNVTLDLPAGSRTLLIGGELHSFEVAEGKTDVVHSKWRW